MKKRNKTFFGESLQLNSYTYMQYFYRLAEIAISRFEWTGLPDTCDPRYIEMACFTDGAAVVFDDPVMGLLSLSYMPSGSFGIYGEPYNRRAFSKYNSYTAEINADNSVIIWNNMMRVNSFLDLEMFAKRLYNLDRTIDVNVHAQKTPMLLTGSEQQQLGLRNLYKDYDGNMPVIFGDKNLDLNSVSAISTQAPYVSDKLYELKVFIWNEALTYLGIPNTNVLKKERVISDEVQRAQAGAFASRNSALYAREQAAEKISEMFDLDVSVTVRDSDLIDTGMPDVSEEERVVINE